MLETPVAASHEAVDEEEGIEGDDVVVGLLEPARDSLSQEGGGAPGVGHQEEDLIHILLVGGCIVMGRGANDGDSMSANRQWPEMILVLEEAKGQPEHGHVPRKRCTPRCGAYL